LLRYFSIVWLDEAGRGRCPAKSPRDASAFKYVGCQKRGFALLLQLLRRAVSLHKAFQFGTLRTPPLPFAAAIRAGSRLRLWEHALAYCTLRHGSMVPRATLQTEMEPLQRKAANLAAALPSPASSSRPSFPSSGLSALSAAPVGHPVRRAPPKSRPPTFERCAPRALGCTRVPLCKEREEFDLRRCVLPPLWHWLRPGRSACHCRNDQVWSIEALS
jgi:hypothetical protein